jgi:regulator of cell morphogenesis and NO signaling
MIRTTDSLADLARTIPVASRVFHRHRLDFCCSGNRSLADACVEAELAAEALVREIEAEQRGAIPGVRWDQQTPAALVQHILDTYHAPLRPEIRRLHEMAVKVETVHSDKRSRPSGLAVQLGGMVGAIEDHLEKEEKILFPMIASGELGFVRMPIQVMMLEHDDHGRSLRRVRELTDDLNVPEEACTTWRALYLGLEQLERDLMDHIHLENNVLFPMSLNG